MSLTSYRAAPPRDNQLRALMRKPGGSEESQRWPPRRSFRPKGFLRREPVAKSGVVAENRALAYCLSMIFSENRFTLFRIMLCVSGDFRRSRGTPGAARY